MGNNQNKTLVIWFDKKLNSEENKRYIEELKRHDDIDLKCFSDSLQDVIRQLKKIKFQNTIIITNRHLYSEFYNEFKKCINDMNCIPKIIVFTGDVNKFISENQGKLPINDPFYNSGGVTNQVGELKKFIESSMIIKRAEFKINPDEKLKFLEIADKNELLLPMYYQDNIKSSTEKQIKEFNTKILLENIGIQHIEAIFAQLTASGNIPINLLTKFWLRAYSAHCSFSINMNEKLLNGEHNDYFPFIQKFYEAVSQGRLKSEDSKLYKGIIVKKNDWVPFLNNFKPSENDLPSALLYGPSFFSFYKDEDIVKKYKENNEGEMIRFDIFIWLILEKPDNLKLVKNQAVITKEISYYDSEKEVLFFPFSCFEINKIEKKSNSEYVITLNYLDKYAGKFKIEETRTFKKVIKNEYSTLLFNSGLIDKNLIQLPVWFEPELNIENNEIITIKRKINNPVLEDAVKKVCTDTLCENDDLSNLESLRNKIQDNLKKFVNVNWYVSVCKEEKNSFGNIDSNSVMSFLHDGDPNKFYINVAIIYP